MATDSFLRNRQYTATLQKQNLNTLISKHTGVNNRWYSNSSIIAFNEELTVLVSVLNKSNKHTFHILELIDYMKYNNIQLDSNRFVEILGIGVSKNDHSAKQIAILWFETMPTSPILPIIYRLSSQYKLIRQQQIWQSIMNELTKLAVNENKNTDSKPMISPMEYITEQLSQIQLNLKAQNNMVLLIMDAISQTNTNINNLFEFMNKNSKDNLLFHKQLFDCLKNKLISCHAMIRQQNKVEVIRGKYIPLKRFFEFTNNFNSKHMEQIRKMKELKYETLLSMKQCSIQLFYTTKANLQLFVQICQMQLLKLHLDLTHNN